MEELLDLNIEKLFGRPKIDPDLSLIKEFMKGKKVLVTGACGTIGSEIARQVLGYGIKKLILLDQDEYGISRIVEDEIVKTYLVDIKQENLLREVFEKEKPDLVFHAAAYKHVDVVEKNKQMATLNNVLGTKNIFEVSADVEKVILISTDKAVKPESILGKTKKAGEILAKSYYKERGLNILTVRFGNVFGSSGSVVPRFLEQIEKDLPLTVTHPDVERFFMSKEEACLLVLEASCIGKPGSTYVLDMGEQKNISNLAKEMIKLSGKDLKIKYTNLREGERMTERLAEDYEELKETGQRKILEVVSSKEDIPLKEALRFTEDVSEIE